jgi:hypothetical protein
MAEESDNIHIVALTDALEVRSQPGTPFLLCCACLMAIASMGVGTHCNAIDVL